MWAKIEGWAKDHPLALGVLIFVLGGFLIYLMTRGGAAAQPQGQDLTGYYQAQAQASAAGNTLAAQQVAAQAAIAAAQLQLQGVETQVGGAVQIATLQGKVSTDIAGLEAQVATTGQQADLALGTLQSTLSAQVAQAGYTRDTNIATINAGAATTAAQLAANTALGEAALSAHTSEAGFLAQLEQLRIQGATTIGVAGINRDTTLGTAAYAAGTTLGLSADQLQLALARLPYDAATTLGTAGIAKDTALGLSTDQVRIALGSAAYNAATAQQGQVLSAETAQYLAYVAKLPEGQVAGSAYPASQFAQYAAIPGAVPIAFSGNPGTGGYTAVTGAYGASATDVYAGTPAASYTGGVTFSAGSDFTTSQPGYWASRGVYVDPGA